MVRRPEYLMSLSNYTEEVNHEKKEGSTYYFLLWRLKKLNFRLSRVPFNLVFSGYFFHYFHLCFTGWSSHGEFVNELKREKALNWGAEL